MSAATVSYLLSLLFKLSGRSFQVLTVTRKKHRLRDSKAPSSLKGQGGLTKGAGVRKLKVLPKTWSTARIL
jgi:hypothetical protein